MIALNISEIQSQFPNILNKVEAGEEIILEKEGKPIAKIVPLAPKRGKRILGQEKGRVWMSDDFNDPLPEDILKEFYK
ncbi:MAG: type II toxin-antitoxin system Phd/YefM family antitoxin [Planctomycetes bacterium]|nr:type II toxin-antitoxin system Phd/YefM family antitoxin [Planctomycetota bacterium]